MRTSRECRGALLRWIDALTTLVNSSHRYRRSDKDDVVWRTLIGNMKGMGDPAGDEYRGFFEMWRTVNQDLAKRGNASRCTRVMADHARAFQSSMIRMGTRDAWWTHTGFLDLGPAATQSGDRICIILGAHPPFLLRKKVAVEGQVGTYQLVGECYIQGLMNGEGLNMAEEQDIILT